MNVIIIFLLFVLDSISYHRAFSLFGSKGNYSLLELMKSHMNEQFKYKLVGVFIRSFISLMQNIMNYLPPLPNINNNNLSTITTTTTSSSPLPSQHIIINEIQKWSPWMLKFCYRFTDKCQHEQQLPIVTPIMHENKVSELHTVNNEMKKTSLHDNTNTSSSVNKTKVTNHVSFNFSNEATIYSPEGITSTDASSYTTSTIPTTITTMKGSYLKVYGESINECDITWQERAQCTSQLLHVFILNIGHDPNILIPTDTFTIELNDDENNDDLPELIDITDATEHINTSNNYQYSTMNNEYNQYNYPNHHSLPNNNNSQYSTHITQQQPQPQHLVKHKYSSPVRSSSFAEDHHTTPATTTTTTMHTINSNTTTSSFSSANKKPKNQEHHHSTTIVTTTDTTTMNRNDEFVVQQLADGMTDEELAQLLQDGGLSSEID